MGLDEPSADLYWLGGTDVSSLSSQKEIVVRSGEVSTRVQVLTVPTSSRSDCISVQMVCLQPIDKGSMKTVREMEV